MNCETVYTWADAVFIDGGGLFLACMGIGLMIIILDVLYG